MSAELTCTNRPCGLTIFLPLPHGGARMENNSLSPMQLIFPGDHGEEATPVLIPNTDVKLLSGDGTLV